MGVGVLSLGERAYLVGLYFADGTMRRHRKTSYELGFALQGDEMEIAERIGGMFRRSGLNPGIRREEDSYVIRVTVIGRISFSFSQLRLRSARWVLWL
jgi:DNA-binding transcriptional regulator WhiA